MPTTSSFSAAPGASAEPLSAAELLFPDFAAEHATTRRFLERFPESRSEWRPHERSRTLAQLATHIAAIPLRGAVILTTDELDLATSRPSAPLTSAAELVARHAANVAQLEAALVRTDLATLSGDWVFRNGSQVLVRGPRRLLLRVMMMSHLVHHRAQLGVYYRLLGLPVPGTYGPSADEG
ncbi:MAG TPA: DinB family protein [Gemmatimonadaceae bacterium]